MKATLQHSKGSGTLDGDLFHSCQEGFIPSVAAIPNLGMEQGAVQERLYLNQSFFSQNDRKTHDGTKVP